MAVFLERLPAAGASRRRTGLWPGLLAALAVAPLALVPALAPVAGEPVRILPLPWRTGEDAAAAAIGAGGQILDAGGPVVVAAGGPGFAARLARTGSFLVLKAGNVSCSRP